MPPKKQRLSLTKAQIQAGVGAELLALCQTITADGVLTNDEIAELRAWLGANRTGDLPAIEFLVVTLERILADGIITKDESKELYSAIEKVLPPEARREAVEQRKTVEAEEKDHVRQERESQRQQEREERERTRPLYSMNFMVAGVHYEGRPDVIREHVDEGDQVFLVRDPDNKFSRNAIEIRLTNGMQIGFVPEDFAPEAAPFIDRGCPHTAYITKVLRGGRVPIPVVQAYLHRPDAALSELVFPDDVPAKRHFAHDHSPRESRRQERGPSMAKGKGCLVALSVACVPATLVAARMFGLLG